MSYSRPTILVVACAGKERRQAAAAILKRHCTGDGGVWPYFVPVGGFMVTPPLAMHYLIHDDVCVGGAGVNDGRQ